MQVRQRKTDGIYCIDILGKLSYETIDSFIYETRKKFVGKNLVINMSNLNFVGSSGVTNFIVAMGSLNKLGAEIKYVGMAKEFIKLYHTLEETKDLSLEVYETEYEALQVYRGLSPVQFSLKPVVKEIEDAVIEETQDNIVIAELI